jgi:hypothetical protein
VRWSEIVRVCDLAPVSVVPRYWTNDGNNTIGEANLDGSDANQSFITGADQPFGLAVSVAVAQVTPATPPAFANTPRGTLSAPTTLTVTDAGQQGPVAHRPVLHWR